MLRNIENDHVQSKLDIVSLKQNAPEDDEVGLVVSCWLLSD